MAFTATPIVRKSGDGGQTVQGTWTATNVSQGTFYALGGQIVDYNITLSNTSTLKPQVSLQGNALTVFLNVPSTVTLGGTYSIHSR